MKSITFIFSLGMLVLFQSCKGKETTTPKRIAIEEAVFASGSMEQKNTYYLSANADGILISLTVKEGEPVEKGQRIAGIQNNVQTNQVNDAEVAYRDAVKSALPNSPELQHSAVQVEQAKKQLGFDKQNYQRYKELYALKSVSKLEFEKYELQYKASQSNLKSLEEAYHDLQSDLKLNVERNRIQLSTQKDKLNDYFINAEQTGVVTDLYKKQGELVRKGETVAQVASGDFIVKLFVAEDDIVKVSLGQSVALSINTYPQKVFTARVSKIHPGFNASEQSHIVEATFDAFPQKMFNGTQLQANIAIDKRENVLVVPTSFIEKGQFVTLESGEEKRIKTGSKTNEWTEVISGLSVNDILLKQ
ncbi:HlyD family efflux transporter periplasmic adaptor subunit [Seonamhaeicola sp.]|uniref:efflux RND transporter periplasmic adaptor subunit n=1 Tax=Seonamhaeicola sp. TaxID=1912245 RepID=UPI0026087F44|nr:HlyD family efflux transporter periplasmic adaptor subunit [Seonamhaeicola sp.]